MLGGSRGRQQNAHVHMCVHAAFGQTYAMRAGQVVCTAWRTGCEAGRSRSPACLCRRPAGRPQVTPRAPRQAH